jgi:hypothetical protein
MKILFVLRSHECNSYRDKDGNQINIRKLFRLLSLTQKSQEIRRLRQMLRFTMLER